MNSKRLEAMRRIKREYDDLRENPISNIGLTIGFFCLEMHNDWPKRYPLFRWIILS